MYAFSSMRCINFFFISLNPKYLLPAITEIMLIESFTPLIVTILSLSLVFIFLLPLKFSVVTSLVNST